MELISFFTLVVVLISCTNQSEQTTIDKIESAHHKSEFLQEEAVSFHLNLTFGGKERLDALLTTTTNSTHGIIEFSNGEAISFAHDTIWATKALTENQNKTRFDAFTWTYFFLFPYKLSDDGTVWSSTRLDTLNEKTYNRQKLTFKNAVGDTPDDWYILFSNPETNLIEVSSYIVTANKTLEEAEADPHAIQYLDYKNVKNIPIAHQWIFWEWREKEGLTKQLGEGIVK